MALFTTSEVVTAAKLISTMGHIDKASDEPVTSSATLQDDNELLFTIGTAGTYDIDVYLFVTSAANAAGDIKVGFTFPTGTFHFGGIGADISLASAAVSTQSTAANLSATSGTTTLSFGASTTTTMIWVHAILIASATGTVRLQWAQNASNANATTVKAGSHMRVDRRL